MRSILAVSSRNARVGAAAFALAEQHNARLTLIETWHAPVYAGLLALSALTPPVSLETLIEDAQRDAAERARIILVAAQRGVVVRSCRGLAAVVAAAEVAHGSYDVVVVGRGLLSRRILGPTLRRTDVELVEV